MVTVPRVLTEVSRIGKGEVDLEIPRRLTFSIEGDDGHGRVTEEGTVQALWARRIFFELGVTREAKYTVAKVVVVSYTQPSCHPVRMPTQ